MYYIINDDVDAPDSGIIPGKLPQAGKQISEPGVLDTIGRGIVRTGARALEVAPLLAGGALGLVPQAAQLAANALGIEQEPGVPAQVPFTPQWIGQQVTEPILGESSKPQSPNESLFDEITGTTFALLSGKPLASIGQAPLKSLATAFGKASTAELAKLGTETVSGSPFLGEAVKLGTLIGSSLAGGREILEKERVNLYNTADNIVPQTAIITAPKEIERIDKIINTIERSDRKDKSFILDRLGAIKNIVEKPTPSTTEATGILNEFGKPISRTVKGTPGGAINVKELLEIKRNLNDYIYNGSLSKSTRNVLESAAESIKDIIDRYGLKNPEFYEAFKKADELHGALNATNYLSNAIGSSPILSSEVAKNPILKGFLMHGVGGLAAKEALSRLPAAAVAGGGLYGAYNGAKMAALLAKSPHARKAYTNLFNEAFAGNTKAMLKDVKVLNKELKKQPVGYWIIED